MSGIPCIVVASGNRTQAFAQSFKDATHDGIMPSANLARALAATLCTFAGTYDPVATPTQQEAATVIMGHFNDAAAGVDASHKFDNHERGVAEVMLADFNVVAQRLVNQILANP